MGRDKKYHEAIDDTFENVLDTVLNVEVENKRIKKCDDDKKVTNIITEKKD